MTDKKKLCQVLYSGLGGHGSVVFSLIEADREKEYEHSLLFYGIEQTRKVYQEDADKEEVKHESILKSQGVDFRSWIHVIRALRKLKPDVILLHSINLILPVTWYCRFNRCKMIAVEHTPMAVKRKSEHWFSKLAGRFAMKVVLLSDDYRKAYEARCGDKHLSKLVVIPNGINIDVYKPTIKSGKTGNLLLSMIGRFSAQKNQVALIWAARELSPGIRLKLAGDGMMWKSIKDGIEELKLEDRVELTGLLNEQQILALLRETDIYVHSSFGEVMPTSIMQAMACGLPVIASDIPGINNLIEDEVDGLLFRQDNGGFFDPDIDRDALRKLIELLVANPERRKELGINARQKAERDFSHIRMFNDYKQLIRSL